MSQRHESCGSLTKSSVSISGAAVAGGRARTAAVGRLPYPNASSSASSRARSARSAALVLTLRASAARARWRWQQSRSKHPSVVLLSCPTPASRAAPALRRSRGGRRHGCSLRGSAARTSAAVRPGQFGGQLRRCSLAHVAASLFLMQRAVAEAVLLLGREEAAAVAV